jgi:UDP-2,3-diacylglucosamine pyrophosphatase LpxH
VDRVRYKVVLSDCHISAGRSFEGHLNAHEDFHFDEELVSLLEYFSTGEYGFTPEGPVEVQLILSGDFFDFLNVPYMGEFADVITEDISLYKLEAIIHGHPKIMSGLRRFVSMPGKKITYMVGNHDADLFFEKIRERITREWDPDGEYPSQKVTVVANTDRVLLDGGVEIRHGNQFEAASKIDFSKPLITEYVEKPVLNIPWGSYYVLKIINRLKGEREFIDKVRPLKTYVLFGLVIDPWFTLRFCFLSVYYFLKTRMAWNPVIRLRWKGTFEILKQETRFFIDLEKDARALLTERTDLQTVIFGHSHRPMNKIYPDGKQYINTGTWTKMINLDWQGIAQQFRRTFVLIRVEDGRAHCELRQWIGDPKPHHVFHT